MGKKKIKKKQKKKKRKKKQIALSPLRELKENQFLRREFKGCMLQWLVRNVNESDTWGFCLPCLQSVLGCGGGRGGKGGKEDIYVEKRQAKKKRVGQKEPDTKVAR